MRKVLSLPFWAAALLAGSLLAAVDYWPIFLGKAPLPAEIVLSFPPWLPVRGDAPLQKNHAEMGDSVTLFYPWLMFTQAALDDGVLPTWNPRFLLGAPFLANAQSAVFYPLHLVYLFLPAHLAWSAVIFLRTLLAVFLAALLARELGASRAGAIAAGLIFAHCGFMVGWQVWPHADAALWLPLILYAVHRLRRRPTAAAVALTGCAFALPVLAGHPEVAIYTVLAGIAFWIFCLLPAQEPGGSSRTGYLLLFTASGLLALGLAAVQLLPTLEWVGHLARTTDLSWGRFRPFPELLSFFSRHARAPTNPLGVPIPEGATYAGILTLLLAPLAFGTRRKGLPVFFFLLFAGAAQVAYGFGPLYRLSLVTPVLRSFPNNRLILLMDFALAILAGLGLTAVERRLARDPSAPSRKTLSVLLAAVLLLAAAAAALLTTRSRALGAEAFGGAFGLGSSWLLLVAGALLLACAVFPRRPLPRPFLAAGALLLLAADLLSFAQGHVPFYRADQIFPEPPVFRHLREIDSTPFRIAALDLAAPANAEMPFGLDTPGGYDFVLQSVADLVSPFSTFPQGIVLGHMLSARVANFGDRRLDLMNVKYFLTTTFNRSTANLAARPDRFRLIYDQGPVQLFENLRVLPRAFLVPRSGALVLPDKRALLERLADPAFDPETTVLLSEPLPPAAAPGVGSGPSLVREMKLGINRHRFRVLAGQPAVMVFSETDYPGWAVYVDGQREKLLRVDYAFKGVLLQPGEHAVEFVFESLSVRAGLGISTLSLLVLLWLCFATWNRTRRNSRQPPASPPEQLLRA